MSEQKDGSSSRVLLCIDEGRLRMPLPFLSGFDQCQNPWLVLCAGSVEARRYASENAVAEVWVASSDEVESINLAAALKADRAQTTIYLIASEKTGSVLSRVHAAALDGVLSQRELEERFAFYQNAGGAVVPFGSDMRGRTPSRSGASGMLLSIVSGSGGAGKSTVSVLAAHLAARRGFRVALLDADLQFGDLHELAGIETSVGIDELVEDPDQLEVLSAADFVLVAAPRRLERAEMVADRFADILDELQSRFDVVVANTGGGWDEQRLRLLERSMTTLFLVDQRVSSIRACRHALDLCLRCGVATGSFLLAANRCHRRAPFTSIDVSSALQGAHVVELAEGGADVEELLSSGMAQQLIAAGNPLCSSLDAALGEMLPAAPLQTRAPLLSKPVAYVDAPQRVERTSRRHGRRKRSQAVSAMASNAPVARG